MHASVGNSRAYSRIPQSQESRCSCCCWAHTGPVQKSCRKTFPYSWGCRLRNGNRNWPPDRNGFSSAMQHSSCGLRSARSRVLCSKHAQMQRRFPEILIRGDLTRTGGRGQDAGDGVRRPRSTSVGVGGAGGGQLRQAAGGLECNVVRQVLGVQAVNAAQMRGITK